MTRKNLNIFIKNRISGYFPEFKQIGSYICKITADHLFVYGFYIDRTSHKENIIQFGVFVQPLYMVSQSLHFTYDKQLKEIGKGYNFNLGDPIDGNRVLLLVDVLRQNQDFFNKYRSVNTFNNYFEDFNKNDFSYLHVKICTMILNHDKGIEAMVLEFFEKSKHAEADGVNFLVNRRNQLKELYSLYKTDEKKAIEYLMNVSKQTIVDLKLNDLINNWAY